MATLATYILAATIGGLIVIGAGRVIYGRPIPKSEWPNASDEDEEMRLVQRFREAGE